MSNQDIYLYMLYYRKDGVAFNRENEIALGIGTQGQIDRKTEDNSIYLTRSVKLPRSIVPSNVSVREIFNPGNVKDFYQQYYMDQPFLTSEQRPEIEKEELKIKKDAIICQIVLDVPELIPKI